MTNFLAKIVAWITAGYPEGVPGPDRVPLFALLKPRLTDDEVKAVAKELIGPRRVRPRRHRGPDHPDHRRAARPGGRRTGPRAPGRQGLAARRPPRRRGDGIAVLRPVAVPSGAVGAVAAARVGGRAGGRRPAVLPVPADDARQTALLTTSLRAGETIDDDVAVVVSTSGTTGVPKGAMLTAAALIASAEATHDRLGGPGRWLLALPAYHVAGLQVLVRSVVAGTHAGRRVRRVRRSRIARPPSASLGSGRRYASLVAAQLDKALGIRAAASALAALDAVLIGGGPMPAGVAERASAAGISVVRTYGMSETAGGCVYDGVPLDGVRGAHRRRPGGARRRDAGEGLPQSR